MKIFFFFLLQAWCIRAKCWYVWFYSLTVAIQHGSAGHSVSWHQLKFKSKYWYCPSHHTFMLSVNLKALPMLGMSLGLQKTGVLNWFWPEHCLPVAFFLDHLCLFEPPVRKIVLFMTWPTKLKIVRIHLGVTVVKKLMHFSL